jgi:hypothetical protein
VIISGRTFDFSHRKFGAFELIAITAIVLASGDVCLRRLALLLKKHLKTSVKSNLLLQNLYILLYFIRPDTQRP